MVTVHVRSANTMRRIPALPQLSPVGCSAHFNHEQQGGEEDVSKEFRFKDSARSPLSRFQDMNPSKARKDLRLDIERASGQAKKRTNTENKTEGKISRKFSSSKKVTILIR